MPLLKDTISVPVNKGINTRTPGRLVSPDYLLEAKNSRLGAGGSSKRFGHVGVKVREGTYPLGVTEMTLSTPHIRNFGEKRLPFASSLSLLDETPADGADNWVWGWGIENLQRNTTVAQDEAEYPRSEYPEAGVLFGAATRDDEILSWDGFNLYSYVPGANGDTNKMVRFNAVMPLMRAKPVAKVAAAQYFPDSADNGARKVIVWLDKENSQIKYTVLDSATEAVVLRDTAVSGVSTQGARVVFTGEWFHIIFLDTNLDTLTMVTFHEATPDTTSVRSLGDAVYWDFWKHNEDTLAVIRSDAAHENWLSWFEADGSGHPDYASNINLATDHDTYALGICLVPQGNKLGLIYASAAAGPIYVGAYNLDGSKAGAGDYTFGALTTGEEVFSPRLTISPSYEQSSNFSTIWTAYASCTNGNRWRTTVRTFDESAIIGPALTRYHMAVASHAFNVGHRSFVWVGHNSTLQSMWLLMDSRLKPVGRLDFALAATPTVTETDITLCTPNFVTPRRQKDRLVYHMALGYRLRVPTDDDQVGLFTEPSIKHVQLDFLPWLRSAQAGRCTYFAGAQLWAYDGAEVVEQGFHLAPEFTLGAVNGGSLTASGTYSYRVDLCYPNAQGEEVRSHSLLVQETLGSEQTIVLTIKCMPTRREGSYFLIYRNAMVSGAPTTTWNLLNSRDPASPNFLANDNTVESVTFTDDGTIWSDTAIQSKEAYPGNNSAYLYPFSSPGCELVCAGADRLWVAGGELPAGQVAPSRLFDPGDVPSFNANINRQVDRGDREITALGFVGGVVLMFRENSAYILDGDGPDNYANGYWPPARLALADVGAVSQESLALISPGLMFQSRAGIRMIGPGGAFDPTGAPVDPTARAADLTVRSAVVVPQFSEVRWYGEEYVLVFNYLDNAWSTWTVGSMGAVYDKDTNMAAVVTPLGKLLIETADLYTDDGAQYEHRIRFPWLHAGNLGDFQRIRRFSGMGEWANDPHRVRAEIYYDERAHWEEYWEWDVPDDTQNEDTWGAATWGAGVWGDTTATDGALEDSVWRFRRRPHRQKCSVFSIAISDLGSPTAGFTLTVLGLELAKKPGLDRIAPAGGTNSYRS